MRARTGSDQNSSLQLVGCDPITILKDNSAVSQKVRQSRSTRPRSCTPGRGACVHSKTAKNAHSSLIQIGSKLKRPKRPKHELTEWKHTGTSTQHTAPAGTEKEQLPTTRRPCASDPSQREGSQTKRGNSSRLRSHRTLKSQFSLQVEGSRLVGPGPGALLPDHREAHRTLGGSKVLSWRLPCYLGCVKPVKLHTIWLRGL